MREGFTGTLRAKCPPSLPPLIERAAGAKMMTASEYTRRAVIAQLEADGVTVAPQQFALVEAGQLVLRAGVPVVVTKLDPDDSRTWLPIEAEDSEPFDPRLHWREKPTYRVDGARVVRTYPIVPKSLERA
jgi:hypothetical protein